MHGDKHSNAMHTISEKVLYPWLSGRYNIVDERQSYHRVGHQAPGTARELFASSGWRPSRYRTPYVTRTIKSPESRMAESQAIVLANGRGGDDVMDT
jgi:hypothetical protein